MSEQVNLFMYVAFKENLTHNCCGMSLHTRSFTQLALLTKLVFEVLYRKQRVSAVFNSGGSIYVYVLCKNSAGF